MKIGIMQPYFIPYIGYWQLINSVDKFVIYDNIQYTKSGWIRRNRILVEDSDKMISLPLKNGSDYLNVNERELAQTFSKDKLKILNLIKQSYKKAPYFNEIYPIVELMFDCSDTNLFNFIFNSIKIIINYLEIDTEIVISSTIDMDHTLTNKHRVIEICKKLNGSQYINPIGGTTLYDKDEFLNNGIVLNFIQTDEIFYEQFGNEFLPYLSIIDVLMFNSKDEVKGMINKYKLV